MERLFTRTATHKTFIMIKLPLIEIYKMKVVMLQIF